MLRVRGGAWLVVRKTLILFSFLVIPNNAHIFYGTFFRFETALAEDLKLTSFSDV